MKPILAAASLCLVPLLLTGCGPGNDPIIDQAGNHPETVVRDDPEGVIADDPDDTVVADPDDSTATDPEGVVSNDHQVAEPDPATGGSAASVAFSQTLRCYTGTRPYYANGSADNWLVSFDGDQLRIQHGNQTYGGRFSTSGNPTESRNTATTTGQQTQLGASGGRIWFERDASGQVVSAGQDGLANGAAVQCGSVFADQWVEAPEQPLFGKSDDLLVWDSSRFNNLPLNCQITENGEAGSVVHAVLTASHPNDLWVIDEKDRVLIYRAQANSPAYDTSFVHESPFGGGRVWISRSTGDTTDTLEMQFQYDFNLLSLQSTLEGVKIRCVPAPLSPVQS